MTRTEKGCYRINIVRLHTTESVFADPEEDFENFDSTPRRPPGKLIKVPSPSGQRLRGSRGGACPFWESPTIPDPCSGSRKRCHHDKPRATSGYFLEKS